ncbi:MAG: TetR family transcriptional regulator [Caulobacter sp.]|nr:TetR family transcriptional regulator [Caulobacter sp.]
MADSADIADAQAKPATARFEKRKDAVLAAAIEVLNAEGFKGMTLADVAAKVGLTTTSVTYYFRKKEILAVECFLHGLQRFDALVDQAALEPDLAGRLSRLLSLYLDLQARVRRGEEPPMTIFSDIRALSEEYRGPVSEAYRQLFMKIRGLFRAPGYEDLDALGRSTRTHILLEQIFWSVAWLPRYEIEDFPRLQARMFDILAHGLAGEGQAWDPVAIEITPRLGDPARDAFLTAATPLINQRSYRGVSVTDIAARLNVTKGSFYHHLDAKDDVVVACFDRTFEVMRAAQLAAQALPGDQWRALSSAVSALVARQVTEEGLLLRTSALQALPEALRTSTVWRADRVSQRFASMISDGIAEGSVRAIDPVIAAQMVSAAINAAADLIAWAGDVTPRSVVETYARPALTGLLVK